ncbi:MAG: NAD-dependent epimerase/dehydratase family protein [Treponema sp.]|jgi:nucleoside-diphosphate-sugar epimerase|nr:NAD-dependent epimerase/dehydratase family protein [Treponema sp.]
MKILFIGGTGTISMAITRQIAAAGQELYILNRGNRLTDLDGVHEIHADIHNEAQVKEKLQGMKFDTVADFIAFTVSDLERDFRLFSGRTKQFIFISSASAYQKPPSDFLITESTPLINPYWEYSRNKIAGEEFLMEKYRNEGFPVTIVRPSHTYDERRVPVAVHGAKGSYQVLARMLAGKPVIIPGDGTTFWTLTFNTDFAAGFIGLIGNPRALGQAVQIMVDERMSWNQIYEIVADALGVKLSAVHIASDFLGAAGKQNQYDFTGELIGDKAYPVLFDISKLKRLVPTFRQKVTMQDGLRKAAVYIMSHSECRVPDPDFDSWCDAVIKARNSALRLFS